MDVHFNAYKIRYALLDHYMQPILRAQPIKSINIFINLDDLIHGMHRPVLDREFQVCGKNAAIQFVSNILNLTGHYRNWAIKRRIFPTIYLVYTSAKGHFRNELHCRDYRKHYLEIMDPGNGEFYFMNDAIRNAFPILTPIVKYLEHIYAVDSKYLEPSMIPYLLTVMDQIPSADWNLMVSRDIYDAQYAYLDRWSLISPRGEQSVLVTRKNLWEYITYREHVYKDIISRKLQFAYQLYPYAKAVIGDRYRNIPKLKSVGWKTLLDYMEEVTSDEVSEEIYTIQANRFADFIAKKKISVDALNRNRGIISVEDQAAVVLDSDKAMIISQLTDMVDYAALKELNGSLFHLFPLNLDFLCNQVDTEQYPTHLKW